MTPPEKTRHTLAYRKNLIAKEPVLLFISSFIIYEMACSHRPYFSDQVLREKWNGKGIHEAIEKLGTPDHVVQYSDSAKCYYFRFTEKEADIDIFHRKTDYDVSTIKIQEQIARAEQSSCLCSIEVRDKIIQSIDFSGKGCINIKKKLER